jgi:catechol 2,3-dioxygenase-like lactoylglutathione lyase family enzyme
MNKLKSSMKYCMPVIPSTDLEKSLRFWVDGLRFTADRHTHNKAGKLIGVMVHDEQLYFWLNETDGSPITSKNYEGIRLYWTPENIHEARAHLKELGFKVSDIADRDYGNTEFFVTDNDGYEHCFGVAADSK